MAASRPANRQSPADAAYETYKAFVANKKLFKLDDGQLTEADTRAKFIDPIFRDVLGWNESEIRREKPVSNGFVDYVLGSEFSHLLIEAKRSKPRFQLSAAQKPRRLKIDGPHLLGHKKNKEAIQQAQSYASDLGVRFCLVTNGSQFVIFQPYLPGSSWRKGTAIIYHDHHDIEQNFAEFYELLARDRVSAGSLLEAFDHLDRTTAPLFTPLDYVTDANRELLRNRVWQKIARTMQPLLTDQSEDTEAQLEVIANCYVTTALAGQTDDSLDQLLRDNPPSFLTDAGVVDLKPGHKGRTAFSHRITADVQSAKKGAYILTGGVGSGKTTFLRRFANIVERDFVERFTVWLHVDFLRSGNVDPGDLDRELREFVYRKIREQLMGSYGNDLTNSGERLRELFKPEIDEARLTVLHGVEPGTADWTREVNRLVDSLYRSDERFDLAALRYLRGRGKRIAVVLDNTDQLGELVQERVFLLSQRLADEYQALCVVTLREEKFFAAYRRGIFDAFGDRRFHIGSPDLRSVLRRRLEYGRKKFAALAGSSEAGELSADDLRQIDALLKALIDSSTGRNANIVRMLASVSNGDMRHALDMFRDFLSSGNTNIEKIIGVVEHEGHYTVPFHEFAKSAILGSRRYYRSDLSHIVNLFKQSDALGASHLTACRVLARLMASDSAASLHGEGFISVATLMHEWRESFGIADDFVQWAGELLRRNLIESEPPRAFDIREADAIRISAAGAYYWRYLVRSFAYIDLVFVDTPLADRSLARRLATMAEMTDMNVRFERVRAFLAYLAHLESAERQRVAERAGPYVELLVPDLRKQIEREIRVIAKKTRTDDTFGPDD